MSALTLTLRERPAQCLDLSALTPDKLQALSAAEVARLPLLLGNRACALSDMFAIGGDDPGHLVIANACDRLDHIGAGMTSGILDVEGDAGHYLGRALRGGAIRVHGNCGAYAGAGMAGGRIEVSGTTGDFLGSAMVGDRVGMRGGVIVVGGRAGDRVGDRMRRGLILLGGGAGDDCASQMIAGTIVVLGELGCHTGAQMRRGTLLLERPPASLPATFNANGAHDLPFLALLLKSVQEIDGRFGALRQRGIRVQRWVGDRACGGLGEILVIPTASAH